MFLPRKRHRYPSPHILSLHIALTILRIQTLGSCIPMLLFNWNAAVEAELRVVIRLQRSLHYVPSRKSRACGSEPEGR